MSEMQESGSYGWEAGAKRPELCSYFSLFSRVIVAQGFLISDVTLLYCFSKRNYLFPVFEFSDMCIHDISLFMWVYICSGGRC